jgi:hypothetical protein
MENKKTLQIAMNLGNVDSYKFLIAKTKKDMNIKQMIEKYQMLATEASKELKISIQSLYGYTDMLSINKTDNPRKPILVNGKDWDYVQGRVRITEEGFELIKEWREREKKFSKLKETN